MAWGYPGERSVRRVPVLSPVRPVRQLRPAGRPKRRTTIGFLIGTAMRPHAGIGQNMAHRSIATGVVSHTLTFHDRFEAGEWLLMAHEGVYAGRGRSYGRAHVFTEDGRAVASFVQESLIRAAHPEGSTSTAERRN